MKKIFIILGLILCVVGYPFRSMLIEGVTATKGPIEDVREGDVIFQTSLSQQSPLIKMGTRSTITHCGVVVMKDGKPYVLETQKTLVLTPLKKFIARGKDGKYWHKRPKLDNIKIKYSGYLGKPYDLAFKFDNGKFYCSELIYDVYLNQLGVELCKPKTIDDYLNDGDIVSLSITTGNTKYYLVPTAESGKSNRNPSISDNCLWVLHINKQTNHFTLQALGTQNFLYDNSSWQHKLIVTNTENNASAFSIAPSSGESGKQVTGKISYGDRNIQIGNQQSYGGQIFRTTSNSGNDVLIEKWTHVKIAGGIQFTVNPTSVSFTEFTDGTAENPVPQPKDVKITMKREQAQEYYENQISEIEEKITDFLVSLNGNNNGKINVKVRNSYFREKDNFFASRFQDSTNVVEVVINFIDSQNENHFAFAASIDLEITDKFICMNTGSIGYFNRENNLEYVYKSILIGKIWLAENRLINLIKDHNYNLWDSYKQKESNYFNLTREIEKEEHLEKIADIKSYIKVNTIFDYHGKEIKIVKVTPKYVWYVIVEGQYTSLEAKTKMESVIYFL